MGCCCSGPQPTAGTPSSRSTRGTALLLSPSDAQRHFHAQSGVVKFNIRARTGIDYLVKAGIIQRTPESVARFLFAHEAADGSKCDELNRQRVGEFLGTLGATDDARAFHRELLTAFMARFSFSGLSVVGALRSLLVRFRLPGEAQIIDRLVQRFADAYVRDNRAVGLHPDAVYSLAFAAIMLNTDLHNPRIRAKMTLAQFRTNLRDVDAPAAVVEDLFRDIAATPIALDLDCDVVTFFAPAKVGPCVRGVGLLCRPHPQTMPICNPFAQEGWLLKRCSGGVSRWKRRYVLIADGCLYYFTSQVGSEDQRHEACQADGAPLPMQGDVERASPRLILPLEGAAVESVGALALRLVAEDDGAGWVSATAGEKGTGTAPVLLRRKRVLRAAKKLDDHSLRARELGDFTLRASNATDRDAWLEAIAAQIIAIPLRRLVSRGEPLQCGASAAPLAPMRSLSSGLGGPAAASAAPSVRASAAAGSVHQSQTGRSDADSAGNGLGSTDQLSLLVRPPAPSFSTLSIEDVDGLQEGAASSSLPSGAAAVPTSAAATRAPQPLDGGSEEDAESTGISRRACGRAATQQQPPRRSGPPPSPAFPAASGPTVTTGSNRVAWVSFDGPLGTAPQTAVVGQSSPRLAPPPPSPARSSSIGGGPRGSPQASPPLTGGPVHGSPLARSGSVRGSNASTTAGASTHSRTTDALPELLLAPPYVPTGAAAAAAGAASSLQAHHLAGLRAAASVALHAGSGGPVGDTASLLGAGLRLRKGGAGGGGGSSSCATSAGSDSDDDTRGGAETAPSPSSSEGGDEDAGDGGGGGCDSDAGVDLDGDGAGGERGTTTGGERGTTTTGGSLMASMVAAFAPGAPSAARRSDSSSSQSAVRGGGRRGVGLRHDAADAAAPPAAPPVERSISTGAGAAFAAAMHGVAAVGALRGAGTGRRAYSLAASAAADEGEGVGDELGAAAVAGGGAREGDEGRSGTEALPATAPLPGHVLLPVLRPGGASLRSAEGGRKGRAMQAERVAAAAPLAGGGAVGSGSNSVSARVGRATRLTMGGYLRASGGGGSGGLHALLHQQPPQQQLHGTGAATSDGDATATPDSD